MSDGGFAYVKDLFAPQHVVGLSVPGAVNGIQRITVWLEGGRGITVTGTSVEQAWAKLALRASTASPSSPNGQVPGMTNSQGPTHDQ